MKDERMGFFLTKMFISVKNPLMRKTWKLLEVHSYCCVKTRNLCPLEKYKCFLYKACPVVNTLYLTPSLIRY